MRFRYDVLGNLQQLIATFFFLFGFVSQAKQPDQGCIEWLKAGNVKAESSGCEIECATLMTDMGTFMCPDQCDRLCKPAKASNIVGKFIYYPGLTPAEKKLVEDNPKDAMIVFVQKTRAELSSNRNFPNQNMNDESDAFRHFVWAGLLTKELGSVKAKEFLDAHENDPDEPDKEKQMDFYNNSRGQLAAQNLISDKKWDLKNLEAEGLDELRQNKLQVLKPGLPIPKEPK